MGARRHSPSSRLGAHRNEPDRAADGEQEREVGRPETNLEELPFAELLPRRSLELRVVEEAAATTAGAFEPGPYQPQADHARERVRAEDGETGRDDRARGRGAVWARDQTEPRVDPRVLVLVMNQVPI